MKIEIAKMLRSAEDCLLSAEHSLAGGWYKAAANRTYYCIFDCISALLHHKDVFAKTHQGAHLKFAECYIKPGILDIRLAKALTKVFDLRQSSDYDFEFEPDEADILAALEHARTFLAATRAYFEAGE
ncbi:MAG: HEPN domain-containing protein [Saprospiraceae bacterium]